MKKFLSIALVGLLSVSLIAQERTPRTIATEIQTLVNELLTLLPPDPPPPPPVIVPPLGQSLAEAIQQAPNGATLDLTGREYTIAGLEILRSNLTIRGGTFRPSTANVNDLLLVRGDNITLDGFMMIGDGTTKRGIAVYGRNLTLLNFEIRNIRRPAQESQALAIWDSPGPLTVRDGVLESSTQSFLSGGSSPTVPNTIPTGLTFERVTFTRPVEWRGTGLAVKTIFELKAARNVRVIDSIFENMWSGEGQTGIAITFHPSQYGNSPETVVEDVLIENSIIRNVGGGVSLLGFSQHQNEPGRATLRGNTYRFINNTWTISKALYGGQGALMTLDWEPNLVVWEGNTVTADGDAFIRCSTVRPTTNFTFTANNNVNRAGTYGIWAPDGNYRGVGWATLFPGGLLAGNTFTNAHATFRANFPNNTWVTVP